MTAANKLWSWMNAHMYVTVFVLFGGCVTQRLQIITRPPVPETLLAQPDAQAIDAVPLAPGAACIENPAQLVIDVNGHRPGQRMLALVSVTTTLVLAFDAVNDRKFTQACTIP